MRMFILIAVAVDVWLWPLVGAQPLCRVRQVRTGKVFNSGQPIDGDALYFPSVTTRLIKHPCKKTTALYLGQQVFFTNDNFENSLPPLTIPASMMVGRPEVTSAHFTGSQLLLVVNQKVYTYDYTAGVWNASQGIQHPVSHVSGDSCCFSKSTFCLAELVGTLGGIFSLHSLSQVGLLVINDTKAMFAYSDHPLDRSLGLAFDYNETLEVLLPPGQRGLLILWSRNSLFSSLSAGQIMETIQVQKGGQTLLPSIFGANITIHSIAACVCPPTGRPT